MGACPPPPTSASAPTSREPWSPAAGRGRPTPPWSTAPSAPCPTPTESFLMPVSTAPTPFTPLPTPLPAYPLLQRWHLHQLRRRRRSLLVVGLTNKLGQTF